MSKFSIFSGAPRNPAGRRFLKTGLALGLCAGVALAPIAATPAYAGAAAPAVHGALAPTALPAAKGSAVSVKTTANVHLRQGASTKKKSLKLIPAGTTLKATGQASNGWYKVSYKGATGYISNAHATKVARRRRLRRSPPGDGPLKPATTAPTAPG